jgi:hypothetical protein
MYKNFNIGAAATTSIIGENTKARVRVQDGLVQIRPTERASTINMPKTEMLRNITVKGNGRRIGLPSEIADLIPTGAKVALTPGKYGWFTIAPVDAVIAAGSPAAVAGSVTK